MAQEDDSSLEAYFVGKEASLERIKDVMELAKVTDERIRSNYLKWQDTSRTPAQRDLMAVYLDDDAAYLRGVKDTLDLLLGKARV